MRRTALLVVVLYTLFGCAALPYDKGLQIGAQACNLRVTNNTIETYVIRRSDTGRVVARAFPMRPVCVRLDLGAGRNIVLSADPVNGSTTLIMSPAFDPNHCHGWEWTIHQMTVDLALDLKPLHRKCERQA